MAESVLAGEWRRAQECLGAANLCRDNGFFSDAVSRSYYAIMHAAKATLVQSIDANGESMPRNHGAVANRFGLYLVEAGHVEREWGASLKQSYQRRLRADYHVLTTLTESDAQEAVEQATAFLNRLATLLGDAVA